MEVRPSHRSRLYFTWQGPRVVRFRSGYAAAASFLLLVELAIALYLDDRLIRPYVGDSLAVILVYCTLRSVTPLPAASALLIALTIALMIEVAQLHGLADAVGLADITISRVVLGTSFDPRDLIAYVAGAIPIVIVEALRCRMAAGPRI